MKPFVKVLRCEVLKRGVVVVCGSLSETRPLFDRATSQAVSRKQRDATWLAICDSWRESREESPGCQAITVSRHGDAFIVMPRWSLPVFAHEAYHAAQAVLRCVGTTDEELGAYLVEWMVGTVATAVRRMGRGEQARRKAQ